MNKLILLFLTLVLWGPNAFAANTATVCYTFGSARSINEYFNSTYTEIGEISVDDSWKYMDQDYYKDDPNWRISDVDQAKFNVAITTLMNANKPTDVPAWETLKGRVERECFTTRALAEKNRQGRIDAFLNYYKGDSRPAQTNIVKSAWGAEFKIAATPPAKVASKVSEKADKTPNASSNASITGPILTRTYDKTNTPEAKAAKEKENAEWHAKQEAKRIAAKKEQEAKNKALAEVAENKKRTFCLADARRKGDCGCHRFYPEMKDAKVCDR